MHQIVSHVWQLLRMNNFAHICISNDKFAWIWQGWEVPLVWYRWCTYQLRLGLTLLWLPAFAHLHLSGCSIQPRAVHTYILQPSNKPGLIHKSYAHTNDKEARKSKQQLKMSIDVNTQTWWWEVKWYISEQRTFCSPIKYHKTAI